MRKFKNSWIFRVLAIGTVLGPIGCSGSIGTSSILPKIQKKLPKVTPTEGAPIGKNGSGAAGDNPQASVTTTPVPTPTPVPTSATASTSTLGPTPSPGPTATPVPNITLSQTALQALAQNTPNATAALTFSLGADVAASAVVQCALGTQAFAPCQSGITRLADLPGWAASTPGVAQELSVRLAPTTENPTPTVLKINVTKQNSLPPAFVPTLTGSALVGQALTCGAPVTDPDGDTVTLVYAWKFSTNSGTSYTTIAGATQNTFVLTSTQAHAQVVCAVTATDSFAGQTAGLSVATAVANSAPSAPTLVTLSPTTAYATSTLTCTPTGGSDADGDTVAEFITWTKNGTLVAGATGNTLSTGFAKGDAIACQVAKGDGTALSSATQSNSVTIQNSAPSAPTTRSVTPSSATKATASLVCSASGATDADSDALTYEYQWRKNGTAIASTWTLAAATLTNANYNVADTLICAARATDGTLAGSEATAATVTIANAVPSGTVTCTPTRVVAAQGAALSVTCSGASDADGTGDLVYALTATSGTCPTISAAGAISGTLGAFGTCLYTVKACDLTGACTASSASYEISSFTLSTTIAAPTLSNACLLSFATAASASANLSALQYSGSCGIGTLSDTVGASSVSTTLLAATSGGTYTPAFGVTSGTVNSASSTAIAASASASSYTLVKSTEGGSPYVARAAALTFDGIVQEGREIQSASSTGAGCSSCTQASYGMVSSGGAHVCALTTAGGVVCWGSNGNGQLGDGTTTDRTSPNPVSGLTSGVVAVITGSYHSCALTTAGAVKCWGNNGSGQLGDATATQRLTPTAVSGLTSGVVSITSTDQTTCALTSAGGVKCWGLNGYNQIGDGTTINRSSPTDVTGLTSGAVAVSAGTTHTCALTTAAGLKCWGANYVGQLGDATTTNRTTPVDVSGLTSGVAAVSAGASTTSGYDHTCAITTAGGLKCWGYNYNGQLGDGTTANKSVPTDVTGLTSGVASIGTGSDFSCAVTTAGGAKCWGYNYLGRLGDGTSTQRTTPVDVSGLTSGVVAISPGVAPQTCALLSGGGIKCWGNNTSGQIGDGTTSPMTTPQDVSGVASGATSVAAGYQHTCAVVGGGLKCWGANGMLQLGDGSGSQQSFPVNVTGLTTGVSTAAGAVATNNYTTCAITTAGGVKCWGTNTYSQIGDGTTISRTTPVDVSGITSQTTWVSVGNRHACAVVNGAAKCWGENGTGQLGNATTTASSTPITVNGLGSGVAKIAAGSDHTCALTTAGGVKCWGYNAYGQLGTGNTTQVTTPTDVTGLTSGVVSIDGIANSPCAITTAGAVLCWGENSSGTVGDGTTTQRTIPTAVSGISSGATHISSGRAPVTCAVVSGALKCWGRGAFGNLGNGTTTNIQNTPVAVTGLSSGVTASAGGGEHTCALLTTGALKCWGTNGDGQLGFKNWLIPNSVLESAGGAAFAALIHSCVRFVLQ